MSSRLLIAILVIGILGMAAMGMITKFAFENNKGLQKVARFKQDVLTRFKERGIHEVSYRKLPRNRGAVLRLVGDPAKIGEQESLHREIAEFYALQFRVAGPQLKLVYVPPARMGCGSSVPFVDKEYSLVAVRRELRAAEARRALETALAVRGDIELLDVERQGAEVSVTIGRKPESEAGQPAEKVLREVAHTVSYHYRLPRNVTIRVQLLEVRRAAGSAAGSTGESTAATAPSPGEPSRIKVLAEGRFDHRGRPFRP